MSNVPEPVAEFLRGKRIAVAGVSRGAGQAANAVYRKLRDSGYEALPVNPNAAEVEGVKCYPNLGSIPVPPLTANRSTPAGRSCTVSLP